MLGVSRLVYSMGLHRQMPDAMRRLHPRFRTPYLGILVFSGFACVALVPGQAEFLGAIYAFGAMLSFSMAHLAVLRLRVTQPELARPYRSPGASASAGTSCRRSRSPASRARRSSLLVVSALDLTVAAAGRGWLLLGIAVYVVYRRSQGLDLVSTHKVAIPEPVVEHEAEYDSVLVHVGDGGYDGQLLATAAKLAARKRRGIHVLVTIIVPNALAIDAPMREAEAAAESIIEQAKLQGGRRVSGHWEKVRAGQAGRRIIEEAQDMRAAAVVLALPRRIAGTSVFGKTLETVLAERPCRVIIESRPPARVRRPRGLESRADRMARRRLEGLERVLGVNALFSTAYGNVGSSIYYALGLVASFALGLTPLVFIITGFFFFCTAATYAEATAMYPGGGRLVAASRGARSTSSGRSSRPGAEMLNYVITIAISAFFVPHYIGGLFWTRAQDGARRHHRRRARDRRAGRDQRGRRRRSRPG